MIKNNKEICPNYHHDTVFIKGEQHDVCMYYNLDKKGLCRHDDHNVCVFYMLKHGVADKETQMFINEFSLLFVEDKDFPKNWRSYVEDK